MHNALRWFLLWTLFPFVIVAADPPPPLTRSVLTTNIPPFGLTGQALFRTANLPYLDWSNIVQQVIDTNAFQPASANLTNWSLISTNALTGKLDSNVWWAAWGSLDTNALTGKLDSNYWFTVWGAIATNALTGKLDSNWWWTAYGGKVLTNSGAFIGSLNGLGTNTTFHQSSPAIVPVTIIPQTGSTTNRLEVQDTNGVVGRVFVITSNADEILGSGRISIYPGNIFAGTATNTGTSNTVYGVNSFIQNTTGFDNTAVGQGTLYSNTVGMLNVAMGVGALGGNNTGSNNTAVGWNAMIYNREGSFNTAIGKYALNDNTLGGGNTAVGYAASVRNTTNGFNTSVGYQSLHQNTFGTFNSALGYNSLYNVLPVTAPSVQGQYNVGIGANAGEGITTGNANTFLGSFAGSVALSQVGTVDHATAIGYAAVANVSHQVAIGTSAEQVWIPGKTGVGTNSPQSRAHIVGDNTVPNVLQVDTTNRHSLLVVTTNAQVGVNTNNPQAKLHVVGPTAGGCAGIAVYSPGGESDDRSKHKPNNGWNKWGYQFLFW